MGQYYLTVNLDKRQYLHPHRFGEGLKLLEFGCSSEGTMTALALLLSDGNGRGSGDLRVKDGAEEARLVGSWAGDRIVVCGDYAAEGKFLTQKQIEEFGKAIHAKGVPTLYWYASEFFEDISGKAKQMLAADSCMQWAANEENFKREIERLRGVGPRAAKLGPREVDSLFSRVKEKDRKYHRKFKAWLLEKGPDFFTPEGLLMVGRMRYKATK